MIVSKMFGLTDCVCSRLITARLLNLRYLQILPFHRMKHTELFESLLGCSPDESDKILKKTAPLQRIDFRLVEKTIKMLYRFGIKNEEIVAWPNVMLIHPTTVENHAMFLEEGGIQKISVKILLGYYWIIKRRISALKAHGLINPETNVVESFSSHLEPFPPLLFDADNKDNSTLVELQTAILKHYLMWRLEMSSEELDRILKTHFRIKHKSFRLLRRTLKILENDIGFTKDKIVKNGFLIHSHPDNTLDTLERVRELGGLDIRTVILKHPKIAMIVTDTLIKIQQYLKEFGIPDEAIQKCMHIFTLSSESILKRLKIMQEVPEFQVLLSHPRVVRLVHHQNKALRRLYWLREQKVRCASLHLLSAPGAAFERYVTTGEDRSRGTDIIRFLAKELLQSSLEIHMQLQCHPHWQFVPLVVVSDTFDFLLQKGYSKESITKSIQLLLYTRKVVKEELKQVLCREETITAQELCKISTLTQDITLGLCLYYIERVHHFTGDGVWISYAEGE